MISQAPTIKLTHLDHLWFQVAGTLCNLECEHCFISCSPKNDKFGFLTLEQCREHLQESLQHGVKEYYFTGGEPFMNRQMTDILIETLHYGPATVLTNGTILKDEWLARLAEAEAKSIYSLEFRVSIDGPTPEINDPIRGVGTFRRAILGVEKLVNFGFLPIITMARTWPESQDYEMTKQFVEVLRERGYRRPRLNLLPTLKLGAEEKRTCGYTEAERVTEEMLADFDTAQLICEHSRVVTDKGIYVCPILLNSPEANLGADLSDAQPEYPLKHGACFTCYLHGAICSNPSSK